MSRVLISNVALGLLKKLPESDRKSIAHAVEALSASPETQSSSVPLSGNHDLRMTRAGDFRLVYKIDKADSSLVVLSIFRPEDNQKIENMLKEYLVSHPPGELSALFQDASVQRVRDLWVESDESTPKGRRVVGTGTAEVQGGIGSTRQKEDVEFSFEALLDQLGSLAEVKRINLDVYAAD
jgi:mRNA-degrading endonuclease RelE of RelBE toxin-antitoxin system